MSRVDSVRNPNRGEPIRKRWTDAVGSAPRRVMGDGKYTRTAEFAGKTAIQGRGSGPRRRADRRGWFMAKLTAAEAISGATNRYRYTFEEVVWDGEAEAYRTKNGGRGGTAYNDAEAYNTGDGVEGNQIDVDDAELTVTFKDATYGTRAIRIWIDSDVDGGAFYHFDTSNGITGACP